MHDHTRKSLTLGLLLSLTPLLLGNVPLELPPPLDLQAFTDTTRVSKALITALANRKWLVEADTGEAITARLEIRHHTLRLRLDYSPRRISYHYLNSENLDHEIEDDTQLIHANVNQWLLQLEKEVKIQVQRFYFERDPMEVVPPAMSTAPAPATDPAPPASSH